MWTLITDSYCITGPDYKLWFRTLIPDSNYRLYNYGPWLCTLIRTLITDSWTRIPNSDSGPCYSDSGPCYRPWFLSWIRTLIADPDYEPFLNSFFQIIKHNSRPKLFFYWLRSPIVRICTCILSQGCSQAVGQISGLIMLEEENIPHLTLLPSTLNIQGTEASCTDETE